MHRVHLTINDVQMGELIILLRIKSTLRNHMDSIMDAKNKNPQNNMPFNLNNLSSSHIEKVDQWTNTDQPVCNCQCDEIPKLKEKAHKSFMQVIQIQNLYKEQILQLKQEYQEREKNKDKQCLQKEELMNQKCRELETEVKRYRQMNLEKIHQIQIETNPFTVDNIQTIYQNSVEQSIEESLYNIKEFANQQNFDDFTANLKNQLTDVLEEAKQSFLDGSVLKNLFENAQKTTRSIFSLIKDLKQSTINAYQKYNEHYCLYHEYQAKYNKLMPLYESLQKQNKFMIDQIKRISSEKIKTQQKYSECERSNQQMKDYIQKIQKMAQESGAFFPSFFRKQNESSFHSSEQDSNISVSTIKTIVSSKGKKASPVVKLNKPAQKPQVGQLRKRNPLFFKK